MFKPKITLVMHLTKEDQLFKESLREFLEEEIASDLPEADQSPLTKEEAVKYQLKLGEMDIGPGAGLDAVFESPITYAVMVEEIARVWPSLVMTITMGFPFPANLVPYAGEQTRDAFGEQAQKGELIGCLAVTETGGGSETKKPDTTAVRDGDRYVLNGEKTWISNAPIADVALVLAWDEEINAADFFMVDRDTTGFESRALDKLGWKASPTGQLFLDNCTVSMDNKLMNTVGEMAYKSDTNILEHPVFQTADPLNAIFSYMRTGMTAIAVGTMQAAFESALDYAMNREIHGNAIGGKQLVQDMLFEMKTGLVTSRLLLHEASRHIAIGSSEARMYSSMAKAYSTEKAVEVTGTGLQLMGANGLSPSYDMERYYRDARTTTIPDGTTEIQKLIVGSELTGLNAYK